MGVFATPSAARGFLNTMKECPPEQSDRGVRSHLVRFVLAAGFLCGAIALTLYCMNPPPAVGEEAPATEFASGRALKHLRVIAQRPHPVGSVEHQMVLDYLVAELTRLGSSPEIQTTSVGSESAGQTPSAPLKNIIVRLKGSNFEGRALMLAAHYDSVPGSPGASDDGAGVTTLLETLRAVKAGPPLKNDVIFLFTDGEEIGTLGAKAFVGQHVWARDIGLVLNFEARGSSGPVFMFETSKSNGRLIREFSRAAPRPFANSLMNEFYELLGNDTDLTVFKKGGLAGLNFAYVGGSSHYHNSQDDISSIDERSVQHQGTYALALTRQFGNLDLTNMEAPDVIYFDFLGRKVFSYSHTGNGPLTVTLLLLAAAVSTLGLRTGRLSFSGVVTGMLWFILSIVCALILTTVLWDQIRALPRVAAGGRHLVYYLWSLIAITVSIITTTYVLADRRRRIDELSAGALLALTLIAVAVNFTLPGGSFLLTWPLVFSLMALGASFVFKGPRASSLFYLILLAVCSLPGIVLFTQMLHNVFQGMSLSAPYLLVAIEALLLGLLLPFRKFMMVPYKWAPPIFFFIVGLIFFGVGWFAS